MNNLRKMIILGSLVALAILPAPCKKHQKSAEELSKEGYLVLDEVGSKRLALMGDFDAGRIKDTTNYLKECDTIDSMRYDYYEAKDSLKAKYQRILDHINKLKLK